MLSLFFVPTLPESGSITITGDEAHHAIKVTRMEVGDEILVTDGSGAWVQGRVTSVDKKVLKVEPITRGASKKSKPELIVIQALAKSDRSKEAIELMTAAGADVIIGWQAERSIAKWQDDFLEKWRTGSAHRSGRTCSTAGARSFSFSTRRICRVICHSSAHQALVGVT